MQKKDDIVNILIVGVGGQGVILASEILSEIALLHKFDVKKSEVHGMSQRGGIVSSHVRFGKKVASPLIKKGEADILLGFEEAEALRIAHFLKVGGIIVVNKERILPTTAFSGKFSYPCGSIGILKRNGFEVWDIPAGKYAAELGNFRLANIILLGVISKWLPFTDKEWKSVIEKRVPKAYIELNLKAFNFGKKRRVKNDLG